MPTSTSSTDAARESRVRRLARRQGFLLRKDRARSFSLNHQGGFMVVDSNRNAIVAGERFDLDLGAVEAWLAEDESAV